MIGRVTELACYRKALVALWREASIKISHVRQGRYFRVFTYSAMALAWSSVRPEIPFLCGGLLSASPLVMCAVILSSSQDVPCSAGAFTAGLPSPVAPWQ